MSNKKLFANSFFYSLGVVLGKATGLLLLPIYTNFMSDHEYGIATTLTSFSAAFGIILSLSLRAAMIRFHNEYTDEQRKRFIGSIVSCVILSSASFSAILILSQQLYAPFVFKGIDFFPLILAEIISMFFSAIYSIQQSVWQAEQNGKAYSVNSMLYLLGHGVINTVFVAVFKWGAGGIIYGSLVLNIIFAVYGVTRLVSTKKMIFCLDKVILKKSVLYSLPIIPHNLSNNISTFVSKTILNHSISYGASGHYTIASQVSTIMSLVQSSINLAFRPWFIEQMENGDEGRKQIRNTSVLICSVYCFVSVGVALVSQEFMYVFTSAEYRVAWKLVPILVSALTITFIYYSHIQTIMYNVKASKFAFVCSITGCLTNILLAAVLVKPLDSYGVALAYLLSQILLATITVTFSRKAEKVDFGLGTMIFKICIAAALMGGALLPSYIFSIPSFNIFNLLYKFAFLVVAFLILLKGYYKTVFNMLISTISKKLKIGKNKK